MTNITILGAGGFGTALAVMNHKLGNNVTVWSCFEDEIQTILKDSENKKLLPGIKIPGEISMTTDIACTRNCKAVIFAVPSGAVRSVAEKIKGCIPKETLLVNTSKGFDGDGLQTMSQVLTEIFPENKIVTLSGPSHAEEVALGIPTTVVAASHDIQAATYVQNLLMNDNFRIYTNSDVIGVELGGTLKNIIALAAGIIDGLSLGDNTKAALMTRGMAEITRLGTKLGGKSATFSGLSGMGDLIVTCLSEHSRNRRAGILIGEGFAPNKVPDRISMTVEGYPATKYAYQLAKKYKVEMPITEQTYSVLFEGCTPIDAVRKLMSRDKKSESETDWLNAQHEGSETR